MILYEPPETPRDFEFFYHSPRPKAGDFAFLRISHLALWCGLLALVAAGGGCQRGQTWNLVPVEGTITKDGRPLAGLRVILWDAGRLPVARGLERLAADHLAVRARAGTSSVAVVAVVLGGLADADAPRPGRCRRGRGAAGRTCDRRPRSCPCSSWRRRPSRRRRPRAPPACRRSRRSGAPLPVTSSVPTPYPSTGAADSPAMANSSRSEVTMMRVVVAPSSSSWARTR